MKFKFLIKKGSNDKNTMSKQTKASEKKPLVIISGIIAAIAISLFAYLMYYVSPDMVTESVKVIANTEQGCIAETQDGFAINIGPCDAQEGQFIIATYDKKVKERAALMNPTT
jgi:hypothetical protein